MKNVFFVLNCRQDESRGPFAGHTVCDWLKFGFAQIMAVHFGGIPVCSTTEKSGNVVLALVQYCVCLKLKHACMYFKGAMHCL